MSTSTSTSAPDPVAAPRAADSAHPGGRAPSRRRWVTLAAGTLAQGAFVTAFFGIAVLAPVLRAQYGLSVPQLGLMLACIDIGGAATLIGWGLLTDRIGERIVVSGGLAAAAVFLLAAARAPQFPALVAALIGAGACGASVYTATGRAVMAAFAPDERGLALAIRHSANPVAGAVAAVVLPPLATRDDASRALTALAIGVACAAVVGALLLRRAPLPERNDHGRPRHPARDRRVWRLSSGSALLFLAQGPLLAFFVVYLHQVHGLETQEAGLIFAAVQLGGGALRLLSGHWSDRRGSRIGPLLQIGSGLAVALLVTGATASGPLALVLVPLAVAGVLSLSWNSLSYTAAAELGGVHAGAALGIQQTGLSLASIAAPISFAFAVEAVGWSVAFALTGLVAVAGVAVIRRLR